MVILENIDIGIDIDKAILQNIDIDKISIRFEFGISNRATHQSYILGMYLDHVPGDYVPKQIIQTQPNTQRSRTLVDWKKLQK